MNRTHHRRFIGLLFVGLLSVGGWCARPAAAQLNRGTPEELQDITFDQKLDAQLPTDLQFLDDAGRSVRLSDYCDGERPVILTLNYFRCPMLCGLMLNGMVDALKKLNLEPGRDFEIVTVSFDPFEGPELAAAKKKNYIADYGRPEAAAGWHFLTGDGDNIKKLTETVGFRYRWNEQREEWAHPAALIFLTPDGRISHYLGGVAFDPPTVRLSLIDASEGKIGTVFDQVFLSCFQYHSSDGAYTASAYGIMRLGGALTLTVLGLLLAILWLRDSRRKKRHPDDVNKEGTALPSA